MPSTCAGEKFGIRLLSIAAFPFMRMMDRRVKACLKASSSSWPVCLALAPASFLTSCSAPLCHPPRVSTTTGRNLIPCLLQSSAAPAILVEYLWLRAWPGVAAAPATRAACRGLTTVTSRAASSPPAQLGMRMSAGLRSWPGSRNLLSLLGLRAADAASW